MNWLFWLVIAVYASSAVAWIAVIVCWRIHDRKIIRELNKRKWWEDIK